MPKWTKERAREYGREWNARNREKRNAVNRQYRAANRERLNAHRRQERAEKRDAINTYNRARRYKITTAEVRTLLASRCAICDTTERLHIDHCHATKKVRGVLCQRCNMALGLFQDDPSRLVAAILYVEGVLS